MKKLQTYLSIIVIPLLAVFVPVAPAYAQFGNLLKDLKELKKSVEPTKQSPDQPAALAVPPAASGQQPVAAGSNSASTPAPSAQSAAQASEGGVQKILVKNRFTVIDTGEAQLALTRSKANSWSDALAKQVTTVKDGDTFWLFVKTKNPLYTYAHGNLDNPRQLMELYFTLGFSLQSGGFGPIYSANSRIIGYSQCIFKLKTSEHKLTELAIQVNPSFRRAIQPQSSNESLDVSGFSCIEPLFSEGSSERLSRGIHPYEMFFMDESDTKFNNDGTTSVVAARTTFTLDISNGFSKFREQYEAMGECHRVSAQKEKSMPICAYR